jgi:hypothetical protein
VEPAGSEKKKFNGQKNEPHHHKLNSVSSVG